MFIEKAQPILKSLNPSHNIRYVILAIVLIAAAPTISGCQFEFGTQEEIKKDVLEADPAFSDILAKRTEADGKIRVINSELSSKSKDINSKILALRKELTAAKKDAYNKIKGMDSQFNPFREELRIKIKELLTELKLKESSLSAINKSVAKLTKLAQEEASSEDLAKEATKWQEKITPLKTQAQELAKEVPSLRDRIRINRLKLRLLK